MDSHKEPSPVNPLPPVVAALFLVVLGLELIFTMGTQGLAGGPGAVGWRSAAIQDYGFSNRAFAWMIENGVIRADYVVRLLSYPFIHAGFTHALFAGVMLLALGKFVGEVLAQWAVLVLFLVSAAFGAVVFGLAFPDGPGLIGAFPGVYGLIGGFTFLLWLRLGQVGERQIQAFSLIAVLLGIQLIFGLFFGGGPDWVADIAGFVCGFALTSVLVPGGWGKLRERLRSR